MFTGKARDNRFHERNREWVLLHTLLKEKNEGEEVTKRRRSDKEQKNQRAEVSKNRISKE
ncbi:hypothetical protein HMPREF1145_1543 [Oribacterium parvum ACB8]|nr:hypothetical protein HMPREF1145_1543 [Oribacterium parvum ACB8]